MYTITFEGRVAPSTVTKTSNIFGWRTKIWRETARISETYHYKYGVKKVYDPHLILHAIYDSTHVTVEQIDTLEAAQSLRQKGHNPLILIFADDLIAGGAVNSGSGAQEESLWRRTNLCLAQDQVFYPLKWNEAVYVPQATVFRAPEHEDYIFLEKPWQASFLACPGVYNKKEARYGLLSSDDEAILLKKMELIFQIGKTHNHDSLVLGALGCGAWACPPQHVANLFQKTLQKYNGVYKCVTFAVLGDNYAAFRDTFVSS